jgi:hypothetical protein
VPQWIVVDSKVYDLSRFADMHPGGSNVLFAEGVGGLLLRLLNVMADIFVLQLVKTRPMLSLLSTDMRFSYVHNMPAFRLVK